MEPRYRNLDCRNYAPVDVAKGICHVRGICNTLAMVPLVINCNIQHPTEGPSLRCGLGIEDLPDKQRRDWLRDLNDNGKCAFVTIAQFALENCVGLLLQNGLGGKPPTSFAEKAKCLVRATRLPGADFKREVIMLPAYIRNTLHSDGIHWHADKVVEVGGIDYVFQRGKRLHCATWSHILYAFSHALTVYEEMFLCPPIAAIGHIAGREVPT